MSQSNTPKPATPPTPPKPRPGAPAAPAAPGWRQRLAALRLDPAALMLTVGGVVLILALWWLWATPRADQAAAADDRRIAALEQRLAALEPVRDQAAAAAARLAQIGDLDARLRSVEARPAATGTAAPIGEAQVAPLLAPLTERLATAERALAQAAERAAAAERLAQAAEARPQPDPETLASRQALEALASRLQAAEATAGRSLAERVGALDQAMGQRIGTLDQGIGQRIGALGQETGQRIAALERQVAERTGAVEQQAAQRVAALEQQLAQRLAAVEQAQRRLAEIEARAARQAAAEAARRALAEGQPLGAVLERLRDAPAALTRYATTAAPTPAALTEAFDTAMRQAEAEAAALRPGALAAANAALSRLGGLVTVRRGEEVVWGETADSTVQAIRAALRTGEVAKALQQAEALPAALRDTAPLRAWIEQARALHAAQEALRQIGAAG